MIYWGDSREFVIFETGRGEDGMRVLGVELWIMNYGL